MAKPDPLSYDSCWSVPFDQVIDYWEAKAKGGRDLAMVRALALYDRYFLLVHILNRKDMLHPWLYERTRMVERDPDGYLDLWAREHYKSTIITFAGIIQEVLVNPDLTVGIFSHTRPIAKSFLRQIKMEFESNIKLKTLFPDVLYEKPERESPLWSEDAGIVLKRKSNPKEATVEAWGLVDGQPISKHFGLLDYDDVVTRDSVSNPEMIQKTTSAWELSDNLGAVGGRKWHVGTRYSYADTYEAMMKRGSVKPRLYPATHDGTLDGRPVLFDQKTWDDKKRDQGEATVSCQMLQNPLAGHQRMFNVKDLQVYEVRPEALAVYILVDPARSKKQGSDNTAMVVLGVDMANNKYLLDGFNHKMDLMERWQKTAMLYMKWTASSGVQAVNVGYESFGAQADLDYFREQQRLTRVYFEIVELAWPRDGEGAKVDRVQRLGPDFRSGKFFLPYDPEVAAQEAAAEQERPEILTAYHERVAKGASSLTSNQRRMVGGYEYRIAKPIKRKDENDEVYDLTEQFKMQIHYFPFGGKKDLADAGSRIYDMEVRPPSGGREARYVEPEYT